MPIYMKYTGVKGDVTAQGHEGWIELTSAQYGLNRHASTVGNSWTRDKTGAHMSSEIVVTKLSDAASGDLFRQSLKGEGAHVEIEFLKDKSTDYYLALILEGTLISSYSISGHGGDSHARPMESLTLNFTKIEFKSRSTQRDSTGAPDTASWGVGQ